MSDKQPSKHHRGQLIAFGMALYRGVLAIVLGIILIFYPTKSQSMLFNIMGFFWLSSGFALIRRPATERVLGQRMTWVVGLVGVFSGLLVVSRNITERWVPEIAVFELLGVVILLTGVLHMMGEFRFGGVLKRRHETLHFLLGLFEIVLGLALILSPLEQGPITYWLATIWSLIFGGLVIGDALVQRFGQPQETDAPKPEPETREG
jgi:uncharacterized membrane protein HdeD (DUF308 family)